MCNWCYPPSAVCTFSHRPAFLSHWDLIDCEHMDSYNTKRKECSVSCAAIGFHVRHYTLIIYSARGPCIYADQFIAERSGIKFTLNDSPSLTSPEETNGAPRWCFNIANYLGVPGKGTDVALRMRTGWGAGQGHHTPRLGSDKRGWLGVFTCPAAIKRETLHTEWRAMDWALRRRGPEARVRAGAWRSTTLICPGYTVGLAARSGLCGRALAKITSTLCTSRRANKIELLTEIYQRQSSS